MSLFIARLAQQASGRLIWCRLLCIRAVTASRAHHDCGEEDTNCTRF
jgi:hypothetical protein